MHFDYIVDETMSMATKYLAKPQVGKITGKGAHQNF